MTAPATTVVAPDRSILEHISSLWDYRELLGNLVRKELKVRYKNSALGFLWSLLTPIMQMVIYTIVFQVILNLGIPYFPIWLLSGTLAWNLFVGSLMGATQSVTGNSSLVNKVWFPREILPLSVVGANSVHFVLQLIVLSLTIAIAPLNFHWQWLWMIVPAVIVLLILTAAGSIFLSAINVYARDTQHLVDLVLLFWFWMTPILVPWHNEATELVNHGLPANLILVNPMASIVLVMQRCLYGRVSGARPAFNPKNPHLARVPVQLLPFEGQWWYLRNLGIVGAVSVVLLLLAIKLFGKLESDFAERL